MSMKLYPEESVQAIADAIREKSTSSDTYTIGAMAQAIADIPSGGGIEGLSLWGTTSVTRSGGNVTPTLPVIAGKDIMLVVPDEVGTTHGFIFARFKDDGTRYSWYGFRPDQYQFNNSYNNYVVPSGVTEFYADGSVSLFSTYMSGHRITDVPVYVFDTQRT